MSHIIKALRFAIKGIMATIKEEKSFRIEILITILVFGLGIYYHLSWVEWAIISLTAFLVLGVEAFNTVIEDLCNVVEPNQNPVIGKIKDISAAAVLLFAIGSVLVALFIFLPHIF